MTACALPRGTAKYTPMSTTLTPSSSSVGLSRQEVTDRSRHLVRAVLLQEVRGACDLHRAFGVRQQVDEHVRDGERQHAVLGAPDDEGGLVPAAQRLAHLVHRLRV